jgi:Piwi domain
MCTHVCMCSHVCTCMYVCMCIHVCTCMHVCMCTHVCMSIHVYLCALMFIYVPPRQEMIADLEDMARGLLVLFHGEMRVWPQNIVFLRDGVSEGQFRQASVAAPLRFWVCACVCYIDRICVVDA